MDGTLKNFLDSGRHLLTDTKMPRQASKNKPGRPLTTAQESDPHKVFVSYAITNKPKKLELLEDIKRFIKQAEDLL